MNNILITIKKELRTMIRDKKTFKTLFFIPLLIPVFVLLYGYIFDDIQNSEDSYSNVGVNFKINDEAKELYKSNLINEVYKESKEELEESYKNKEIDAYIYFNKKENKYTIYASNNTESSIAGSKAEEFLKAYNTYIGSLYILDNKLEPNKVYSNIDYDISIIESDNYLLTLILSIAITYTILAIVMSASNMAVSSTVTEKENGTLETILTLPISTTELIVGKYLASVIMGILFSVFSFVLTYVSIKIGANTYESFKDFSISFNVLDFISVFIVLVVASVLISGLAIYLTAFAKTLKEGQSKAQTLTMITMIPMFLNLANVDMGNYLYFIPVCNYVQLLMDLFNNVGINSNNLLITMGSSIVYATIIIYTIIKQYNSEKVLFAN